MSNECCYIVPSGKTLTSATKAAEGSPKGGTWPGMELAVQGTFSVTASNGRGYAAVTPHLALLPGGKLSLASAYGTIKGDTLDIRGTANNPSLITYNYTTVQNKTTYYAKLDIAFTGDSDGVVKLQYTGAAEDNYNVFERAYRVTKGLANFFGTVIVDGANTWLRPETSATTFDLGGTLWVTNGAGVYIDTVSPTFGSLVMGDGTTLQIADGKTVTVNGPFSIDEGAAIVSDGLKKDYLTAGNPSTGRTVISVCGAANAAAVDRDALSAALAAGSGDSLYSGCIPVWLAEDERADGGVDFRLAHDPFIAQTKSCEANKGPYGYNQYEEYMSDGQEIVPGKVYCTLANMAVYFKSPYVFPGKTWIIAGGTRTIGFYGSDSLTVADLRLLEGAWFRQMSKNINAFLYGAATLYGTVNFRVSGSNMFKVYSTLSGAGDIVVTLDLAKIFEKESACRGTLELNGDNSAWTGRMLVGCGRPATENEEGLTNLTLRVASAASLGGAQDAFTFDAVKIADTCTLAITNTATFAAANRGWCLMGGSKVDVASGKTVTLNETVTFGGAVTKSGAGTLILGGGARFYDAGNDSSTDVPNGASFRVATGNLGVKSAEALDGVDLALAAGVKLLAFPETDGLTLASAPTIEGGTLPVEIVNEDALEAGVVNILTLPTSESFDPSTLSVSRVWKHQSAVLSRVEGDNTVYYVTFSKVGFRMTIQ